MSKQCLQFTIEEIAPSVAPDREIRLKGQATLAGETATAPAQALRLQPTTDQQSLMIFLEPGDTIFLIATVIDQGADKLLIIDEMFCNESEFEPAQHALEAQKHAEILKAIDSNLEFLTWVDRCAFPKDVEEELVELGVDRRVALGLRMNMTAQRGRIKTMVELFQDNIRGGEYKEALLTYLVSMHHQYMKIKEDQQVAQPKHQDPAHEPGL